MTPANKPLARWFMGMCYVLAGVAHFRFPADYERVVPGWIGWSSGAVIFSGIAEVLGGVGLFLPKKFAAVRRMAARGIVALLLCVWPVHFWMLQHPEMYPQVPRWALWIRLFLQVPLIAWAWIYTRREPQ